MEGRLSDPLKRRCIILLLCCATSAAPPGVTVEPQPPLPRSVQHFSQATALHDLARQGDPDAQSMLGDLCFSVRDYTNAVVWYHQAAAQGNIAAQLSLASCYKTGRGVTKNLATAEKWYRQTLIQQPSNTAPPAKPPSAQTSVTRPIPAAPGVPATTSGTARNPASRDARLEGGQTFRETEDSAWPGRVTVAQTMHPADQSLPNLPNPISCSARVTRLHRLAPYLMDVPGNLLSYQYPNSQASAKSRLRLWRSE